LKGAEVPLNALLGSPRLYTSTMRMLNPIWYAKMPGPVRKKAMGTIVGAIAVGAGILGMAAASGFNVELDPRASDVGAVKIGKKSYSPFPKEMSLFHIAATLISNQTKSPVTGKIRTLSNSIFPFTSRLTEFENFIIDKFAPIPTIAADLARGQDAIGNNIIPSLELLKGVIPFMLSDIVDAVRKGDYDPLDSIPQMLGIQMEDYTQFKKKSSAAPNPFIR
jgi:hypothetical protein